MARTGYEDNTLNSDAIEAVTSLIERGRSLCFVGAGLSVELGYPPWSVLVERIQKLAVKHHGQGRINEIRAEMVRNGQDPASRPHWCQRLKNLFSEEGTRGAYSDFLRNEFSEKDPPFLNVHKALVSLPFQHFITTNYDPAIECAETFVWRRRDNRLVWTDRDGVSKLVRSLDKDGQPTRIFHIHGWYDNPDSIVLASDEYDHCYSKDGNMLGAMQAILSIKSLVFFGFSFDKEDVYVEIVKRVNRNLQVFSSGHYAFMPLSKDVFSDQEMRRERRQTFRTEHGIEPIFYEATVDENGKEDHSRLALLVRDMQYSMKDICDRGAVSSKHDAGVAPLRSTDKGAIQSRGAEIIKAEMTLRFDYTKRAKK